MWGAFFFCGGWGPHLGREGLILALASLTRLKVGDEEVGWPSAGFASRLFAD